MCFRALGYINMEKMRSATIDVMGRTKKGTSVDLSPENVFSTVFLVLCIAPRGHTSYDEGHDEDRHEAPFAVMQIVLISQPALRLASYLSLHTLLPPLGCQPLALGQMLGQVLRHVAAFGKHNRRAATGGCDCDDRRFTQGVDFLEFGRRQHRLFVSVVYLQLVGHLELLKQPHNALRA